MNKDKSKILRVKSAILSADEGSSLKEIIDKDEDAFKGIRMLYATNASGAPIQVADPSKDLFSGIFSKSRLLAYSDSIRSEMESGKAGIYYIRRALFDTNLLSDLPKYFKGQDFSTKEKVQEIVSTIETEYNGSFDYCFPMLENLRLFTHENNPHPVNKVSSAIYFDHLLRGCLKPKIKEENLFEPYFEEAETVWMNFRASKDMWHLIDRRDLIYAVLLKTYHLCWSTSRISMDTALHSLVEYCLNHLGVVPFKELYFSWKIIIGFSLGHYGPAFDESPLKIPKAKSLSRIGALAWDLFIFRFSETLMTEEKGSRFYIPTVTTLDKKLLDTIIEYPAIAMISFPEFGYVETLFEDELAFQRCLDASMSTMQKKRILDSNRSIKGEKKLRHHISISISELEKKIGKLV
jgi:hypothetical protein